MPIDYDRLLNTSVAKGELPDFFREESQILPDNCDYAAKASAHIRLILARLAPKKVNIANLRIYISGEPSANAFVITEGRPPILVVNKGLLEKAEIEDEIAGVLAHELMHIELAKEHQDHENNKVEESLCDFASIEALDRAGYQRTGLISLFQRENPESHSFAYLFDPHPNNALRIKNMGNVLARYEKEKGLKQTKANPLPAYIEEFKDEDPTKPRFPYFLVEMLEQQHYATATPTQKINILLEYIRNNETLSKPQSDRFFRKRVGQLAKKLQDLGLQWKNLSESEATAFGELIEIFLLQWPKSQDANSPFEEVQFIYNAYLGIGNRLNLNKYSPQRPLLFGTLARFQTLIDCFVQAKTLPEITHAASELKLLIEANKELLNKRIINLCRNSSLNIQGFPKVQPPYFSSLFKSTEAVLPWNLHLSCSKASKEVREALAFLGILNLVKTRYSEEEKRTLGYENELDALIEAELLPYSNYYGDIAEGTIREGIIYFGTAPKPIEKRFQSFAEAKRYLDKKDALSEKLVVDWNLLETNLEQFIANYLEYFRFELTLYEGGFLFAERIIEQLEIFKAKNPELAKEIFKKLVSSAHSNSEFHNERAWYGLKISVFHPFVLFAMKNFKKNEYPYELANDHISFYVTVNQALSIPYKDFGYQTNSGEKRKTYIAGFTKKETLPPLERRWKLPDYTSFMPTAQEEQEEAKSSSSPAVGSSGISDPINILLKIEASNPYTSIWLFAAYQALSSLAHPHFSFEDYLYLSKYLNSHKLHSRYADELFKLYENQVYRAEEHLYYQAVQSNNLNYLIQCLGLFYDRGELVQDPIKLSALEEKIKILYQQQKGNPQEKRAILDRLLDSQTITIGQPYLVDNYSFSKIVLSNHTKLDRPFFRNWVIEEYSSALSELFGKDNGAVDFEHHAKTEIDALFRSGKSLNLVTAILKKFIEKIQAQKSLSYYARDQINQRVTSKLLKNGVILGSLAEFIVSAAPQDATLCLELIDFLLQKSNQHSLDKIYERLLASVPYTLTPNLKNNLLNLQDNFYDLSFEQQILVVDQLLFPAEKPKTIAEGKKYVLDNIFGVPSVFNPLMMLANALIGQRVDDYRQDKESRQIVESYLEALEELAQNPHHKISLESREKLILSAMLVANAKTHHLSSSSLSPRGEALRQVLEAMGPAGRKLAQAIESHPETPEDIKETLKASKTNAAPPERWEIHEWSENFYLPQARDPIQLMGAMLGSGSYGVTMQAYKQSGAETAITFLRAHVVEQAQDEFMILDRAAKILINKNAVFKSVDDMQHEAALSSKKEVDMDIAAKQQLVAQKLYQDLEISVNRHRFRFGVAGWVGHGRHYKETQIVPGIHFNDLKLSEELEGMELSAAEAILTAELFNLLTGGPTDNDRHGGQQKIVRARSASPSAAGASSSNASSSSDNELFEVGNFDFGGMGEPLVPWQKTLLGHLIGQALWETHKPFSSAQLNAKLLAELSEKQIREYAATQENYDSAFEEAKRFLGSIKRGLLALGNYLNRLGSDPEKLKNIFAAILATKQVDPLIEAGIREKLGSYHYKLDELAKTAVGLSIRLGQAD